MISVIDICIINTMHRMLILKKRRSVLLGLFPMSVVVETWTSMIESISLLTFVSSYISTHDICHQMLWFVRWNTFTWYTLYSSCQIMHIQSDVILFILKLDRSKLQVVIGFKLNTYIHPITKDFERMLNYLYRKRIYIDPSVILYLF